MVGMGPTGERWVFRPDQRAPVEVALAEIFGGEDDE